MKQADRRMLESVKVRILKLMAWSKERSKVEIVWLCEKKGMEKDRRGR